MTRRDSCRCAARSLAFGAMLMLGTPAALAAAMPVTMTPTRYAALTHAPRLLRLVFSEAIVRKSSSVTLTDLSGHQVRVEPVKGHGDNSLEARVGAGLGVGVYMVHWTAVSAIDGSKTTGSYQFTIQ